MPQNTLFYIILAALVSITIAAFHYFYKIKHKSVEDYFLAFLRFLSLFLVLLLLINPKIITKSIQKIKPHLIVAVDNSASIKGFKKEDKVRSLLKKFKGNAALNNKYEIVYYSFGSTIDVLDTLTFNDKHSNLHEPLKELRTLYKEKIAPIVFISDGNQTKGTDYEFFDVKQTIYPIVVGDTIQKQDVKITQLNVNTYTFLKNTFPVEIFVQATTNTPIQTNLSVFEGKSKLFTKKIIFTKENNTQIISLKLPANKVGKHYYKAKLTALKKEANSINNTQRFAVEVVDERAKILILTSFTHPDLGMLKRSIESNPQREVLIKNISESKSIRLVDYQLIMLYQPTSEFKNIFKQLKLQKQHYFVISGSKTDWNFLNSAQSYFKKDALSKTEDYAPIFNENYDVFLIDVLNFNDFPPLKDVFGEVNFSIAKQTLLHQKIGAFTSKSPLLVTFEDGSFKGGVLFGENLWKWRVHTIKEKETAMTFDAFLGKLVQYLANSKDKKRLSTVNKPYYYSNETVVISVDFVDKNYVFNPTAKIILNLFDKQRNVNTKYPFYLENNSYKVTLSNLKPGNYTYSVHAVNESIKTFGSFQIIPFEVEQLFTSANVDKLRNLAANNAGEVFYLKNPEVIFKTLLDDDVLFKSIEKQLIKKTPLINWKWLLGLLLLTLAIEWFARKYLGRI